MCIYIYMYIYIYIYRERNVHIYIYIHKEREREREIDLPSRARCLKGNASWANAPSVVVKLEPHSLKVIAPISAIPAQVQTVFAPPEFVKMALAPYLSINAFAHGMALGAAGRIEGVLRLASSIPYHSMIYHSILYYSIA